MPIYVYKFVDTGETIEVQQGFHEDTLTEIAHPDSGEVLPVRKVFTPVGVTFKGSGFFKTDNRATASGSGSSTTSGDGGSDTTASSASSSGSSSSGSSAGESSGSGSSGSGSSGSSSSGSGSSGTGSSGSGD